MVWWFVLCDCTDAGQLVCMLNRERVQLKRGCRNVGYRRNAGLQAELGWTLQTCRVVEGRIDAAIGDVAKQDRATLQFL